MVFFSSRLFCLVLADCIVLQNKHYYYYYYYYYYRTTLSVIKPYLEKNTQTDTILKDIRKINETLKLCCLSECTAAFIRILSNILVPSGWVVPTHPCCVDFPPKSVTIRDLCELLILLFLIIVFSSLFVIAPTQPSSSRHSPEISRS